jgi:hypothetical protein
MRQVFFDFSYGFGCRRIFWINISDQIKERHDYLILEDHT